MKHCEYGWESCSGSWARLALYDQVCLPAILCPALTELMRLTQRIPHVATYYRAIADSRCSTASGCVTLTVNALFLFWW